MRFTQLALAVASTAVTFSSAAVLDRRDTSNDTSAALSSVQIGKYTYENHGLVAFGRLSNAATDKYGESLGGLGVS